MSVTFRGEKKNVSFKSFFFFFLSCFFEQWTAKWTLQCSVCLLNDDSYQDAWTDIDWVEVEEQEVHPLLIIMKFLRHCRFKQVHFILTSWIFAKWISLFISIFLSFISPKFTLPFLIWSVRQSVTAFHCFYITSSFSLLSQQFPIPIVIFLRWIYLLLLRFDWQALKFRCCRLNTPSLCELPFEDIWICRV